MTQTHWDGVYAAKGDDVSWFESEPTTSLEILRGLGPAPDDPVVDVGGGTSRLAAALVAAGHRDVTVVDLSQEALDRSRAACPDPAVRWVRADVTAWTPDREFAFWHDRAVFHFLVTEPAREAYRAALRAGTRPGSYVVVATFAPDGPEQCSGLPVRRYDAETLAAELGVELVDRRDETHTTPWGAAQPFTWLVGRRR